MKLPDFGGCGCRDVAGVRDWGQLAGGKATGTVGVVPIRVSSSSFSTVGRGSPSTFRVDPAQAPFFVLEVDGYLYAITGSGEASAAGYWIRDVRLASGRGVYAIGHPPDGARQGALKRLIGVRHHRNFTRSTRCLCLLE